MAAVPADPPVTMPVAEPTAAIADAPELHVPPPVASAKVVVPPIHKPVAPVIAEMGLMLTVLVATQPGNEPVAPIA